MESLPMSQSDLLLLLPLGWQNYQNNLTKFAGYKQRYTAQLATDALARLMAARQLPSDDARGADAEKTRLELVEQSREFLEVWQLLEGYIETAYGPAYKPMRVAAGYRHYERAAQHDWAAMTSLLEDSLGFVTARATVLRDEGEMPAAFEGRFRSEADDVQKLLARLGQQQLAAQQGTMARNTALLACYAEFQQVNRDAQRIFMRQPELARLFQTEYLLGIVSGTRQAGVRGTLTLADGAPAPEVRVEVPGRQEPAATVSDADGRYALAVPAGEYTLVFSGTGYLRQEVAVTVEAGVKKRVDAVVGKG
jgi:hypothetical protein